MSTERLPPEREAKLREARARALEVFGGPPGPLDEVLAELDVVRDQVARLREEREAAEAQLAALREACRPALRVLDKLGVDEWAAFNDALTDAAHTAEAYTRRVQAEAADALQREVHRRLVAAWDAARAKHPGWREPFTLGHAVGALDSGRDALRAELERIEKGGGR